MPLPTSHFNTGNPNLDNQLRRLARSVKTAHPAGTGTTRISSTPTGTLQRFSGSRRKYPVTSSGGGFSPFKIYQAGQSDRTNAAWWRTFQVHLGHILPPYQSAFINPDNDDSASGPPNFVVPASSTDYEFYLQLTLGTGFFSAATIIADADPFGAMGTVGTPQVQSDDTNWYALIGLVSTSADTTPVGGVYPAGTVAIDQIMISDLLLAAPNFPVDVTQTGGTAGTASAFCSYTYTVKDLTGLTLATSKAPVFSAARIVKQTCTAGNNGMAHFDEGGLLILDTVDELGSQTNC